MERDWFAERKDTHKLPLIESTTSPIPSDMAVIANKYVAIAKVIPGRNSARDPKPIHSNPSAADKRQFCSGIHTDSPHLNGRCSNEEFSVHSESIHTNSQHKIQTPTNRSKHPRFLNPTDFSRYLNKKNQKHRRGSQLEIHLHSPSSTSSPIPRKSSSKIPSILIPNDRQRLPSTHHLAIKS